MKKTTAKYIKKYIKHLFGLDVEIRIVHHFWGRYGGKMLVGDEYHGHLMEIAKKELKWGFPHSLIWHEVGHIKSPEDGRGSIKSETSAELWALRDMKKRGYNRLYKQEIEELKNWWLKGVSCNRSRTYKIAGRKVLRELGEL